LKIHVDSFLFRLIKRAIADALETLNSAVEKLLKLGEIPPRSPSGGREEIPDGRNDPAWPADVQMSPATRKCRGEGMND